MSQLQFMPGDPRLVDQIVFELKSKGIFDQFRKECIADVDTKPAYQNLRQRVESSVSMFLGRQHWHADLNKNQLRDKCRKHILEGKYLEQGVERIVDQVVNPKIASVFIPQVEDLVYSYLGIKRHKASPSHVETKKSDDAIDLLPEDLEAVSPGSVKSEEDDVKEDEVKSEKMEVDNDTQETKDEEFESPEFEPIESCEKIEKTEQELSNSDFTSQDTIPTPKAESIPPNLHIPMPDTPEEELIRISSHSNLSMDIPLPEGVTTIPMPDTPEKELTRTSNHSALSMDIPLPEGFPLPDCAPEGTPMPDSAPEGEPMDLKPSSEDTDSSFDSTIKRNVSPLTPIRDFDNDNSCDAQQPFEKAPSPAEIRNDNDEYKSFAPISTFRFTIEKSLDKSPQSSNDKYEGKTNVDKSLPFQFQSQINLNAYGPPICEDSSSSNNLRIDYDSDANESKGESKTNDVQDTSENTSDVSKSKDTKSDERKSSYKSSHSSADRHRNKDRRSDSKHSSSKDSHKKSSRDDSKSYSKSDRSHRDKSKDKSLKKDEKQKYSSKYSSTKDQKSSHKPSSSHRYSSSSKDDKKTSKDKDKKDERKSDKDRESSSKDRHKSSSRDHSRQSSSHRSEKERSSKPTKSKSDDKKSDKKDKKIVDDHYTSSGRNRTRRSTDRDSNDGNSSSSKGSHFKSSSKTAERVTEKPSSKSENTTSGSDSTGQSDAIDNAITDTDLSGTQVADKAIIMPVVRLDDELNTPISESSIITIPNEKVKKPMIAENIYEARKLMKMRKFLEAEERRKHQEATLLLEFHENVSANMSQIYSGVSGPELEFVCKPDESEDEQLVIDEENNKLAQKHVIDNGSISKSMDIEVISLNNNDEIVETLNEKVTIKNEIVFEPKLKNAAEDKHCKYDSVIQNKEFALIDLTDINPNAVITKKNGVVIDICKISIDSKVDNKVEEIKDDDMKEQTISEQLNKIEIEKETDSKTIGSLIVASNSENQETKNNERLVIEKMIDPVENDTNNLLFFGQQEIFNAELERHKFNIFFEAYTQKCNVKPKIFVSICDIYEENLLKSIVKDVLVINFYKNGLVLPKSEKKDVVITPENEIVLALGFNHTIDANEDKNIEDFGTDNQVLDKTPINISANIVEKITVLSAENILISPTNFESPAKTGLKTPIPTQIEDQKQPITEITPDRPYVTFFSPNKSECSFDSDYDTKIEEMVQKASRQEIMEIILGGSIPNGSPNKMPKIGFCDFNDDGLHSNMKPDNLDTKEEGKDFVKADVGFKLKNNLHSKLQDNHGYNEVYSEVNDSMNYELKSNQFNCGLKRKSDESENNNKTVLTQNKIRRLSCSEQITSTTSAETLDAPEVNGTSSTIVKTKLTGKARRIGLGRPKKSIGIPKSPSSDKSVENYVQNIQETTQIHEMNGKLRKPRRNTKMPQRYENSDLYKPKLHFLSRRHNITN